MKILGSILAENEGMPPGGKIGMEIFDRATGLLIKESIAKLELLSRVNPGRVKGQLESGALDNLDQLSIDGLIGLKGRKGGDQVSAIAGSDKVLVRNLRHTSIRKEVTEDQIVTWLRQDSLENQTAVTLEFRVKMGKALEILTDNEEVKWHVMQDIELSDLTAIIGVIDGKPEFERFTSLWWGG